MATSLKKIVSISVWSAILCTLLLFIVPLQAQAAISAKSDTTLHGSNTTGSTVTLTFPTGANAPKQNDVVIFFGGHGSAGGAAGPSTAGYTRIASTTAATAPNFGAWYKVMGASPDTTVAGSGIGSTDGTAYAAYLLTGVDTSVFDATSVTAGPTTSTNPDAASITTVTSGAWVLDLAGNNTQDNSPGTVSTFTNLTISDNANSSAADLSIAGAATTSSPVGADNPAAWSTWASGNWFAITIALKPGIAPTVSTQAASPIGATTTTLNGNIDVTGGINASNRGFAWGTNNLLSGGDTATTTEIGDFSTGAFTNSSLTFTANTTYYSRAYATSSAGVGVGSIQSFKTLPAQPGTPTYTSVAATSLTTNWTDTTGATTSKRTSRFWAPPCQ